MSVLREWTPDDGHWYVAQLDDAAIQEFTAESTGTTVAEFTAALAKTIGAPDTFARAIVDPATGDLAGNLAAGRHGSAVEIHYWLAEPARGRGLATAALTETLEWVRRVWPRVSRACLRVRLGNQASDRVALRAGFTRDPAFDTTIQVRGQVWTMLGYSLTLSPESVLT